MPEKRKRRLVSPFKLVCPNSSLHFKSKDDERLKALLKVTKLKSKKAFLTTIKLKIGEIPLRLNL